MAGKKRDDSKSLTEKLKVQIEVEKEAFSACLLGERKKLIYKDSNGYKGTFECYVYNKKVFLHPQAEKNIKSYCRSPDDFYEFLENCKFEEEQGYSDGYPT